MLVLRCCFLFLLLVLLFSLMHAYHVSLVGLTLCMILRRSDALAVDDEEGVERLGLVVHHGLPRRALLLRSFMVRMKGRRSRIRMLTHVQTTTKPSHRRTPPAACSTSPPAASTTACAAHVSHSHVGARRGSVVHAREWKGRSLSCLGPILLGGMYTYITWTHRRARRPRRP